ncbi:MAG TPA: HypC/HybG/HupF family hydrogenase formation chaperone [Gaiellaceae bacterium]|nr:HypC/HybG/HupF family hydrogenase formation chaperone [Gaiellaceae bacterium]
MCIGSIQVLEDAWEEGGARVGRLANGTLVTLAFVPAAEPGVHVIVHLGIPVEVLSAEEAETAPDLHAGAQL